VYFSERAGPTATLGKERLDLTVLVFDYQHDYQAGKLSKDKYVEWMAPVRAHFEATLQGAVDAAIDRARGITNDLSNRQVELCQPDGAFAATANTPIKPPTATTRSVRHGSQPQPQPNLRAKPAGDELNLVLVDARRRPQLHHLPRTGASIFTSTLEVNMLDARIFDNFGS